jgi:hypothetical protein
MGKYNPLKVKKPEKPTPPPQDDDDDEGILTRFD